VRKQIFHKDENPFLCEIFKRVGSAKERKEILETTGPCLILATSGMLVGGPSVEYLKELANDERHSLIFTCYQAEGSLGNRILQRGEREIMFAGNEVIKIKMEVHKLEITGHSDRKQLMNFVSRCNPPPKKIIVNHGENMRILDLASSLHKQFRVETAAPRNLETLRLK
jgi:predicted metal-dependent RNase